MQPGIQTQVDLQQNNCLVSRPMLMFFTPSLHHFEGPSTVITLWCVLDLKCRICIMPYGTRVCSMNALLSSLMLAVVDCLAVLGSKWRSTKNLLLSSLLFITFFVMNQQAACCTYTVSTLRYTAYAVNGADEDSSRVRMHSVARR